MQHASGPQPEQTGPEKEEFVMVFHYRNVRHPVHQLRHEMDRLLSGWFGPSTRWETQSENRGQPAVNLWELDDALVVESELPGVPGDQLDISVVGGELTIKVERPDLKEEGVTYHRRERPVGSFTRVLRLPADVDSERVQAELRHGVLTIRLPKAESAKPRKIAVTSAS
jgi:HSP20 family protein